MEQGVIAELFIYPVKSCRAVAVDATCMTVRGLDQDRRWMIIDANGRQLTQRELPSLARLVPTLDDCLRMTLPEGDGFTLPLGDSGEALEVEIWGTKVRAVAPDPQADRLLSAFCSSSVRIVRLPEDERRPCEPPDTRPGEPPASSGYASAHTGFADSAPLLITNRASLERLAEITRERGEEPVPMNRFRPNIVLEGAAAGAEEHAQRLEIEGRLELQLLERAVRCMVTTVDQERGEVSGKEPLRTLARTNRDRRLGGVCFGIEARPLLDDGARVHIARGCAVTLCQENREKTNR